MDWSLGGYWFYVWGAYFFAFAAIGLELFTVLRRKRACSHRVEDKTKRSPSHQSSALGTEVQ